MVRVVKVGRVERLKCLPIAVRYDDRVAGSVGPFLEKSRFPEKAPARVKLDPCNPLTFFGKGYPAFTAVLLKT